MSRPRAGRKCPVPAGSSPRRVEPMERTVFFAMAAAIVLSPAAYPQQGFFTKEDVIKYTPEWKGERFADGRPKVSEALLDRMKSVTLEEAWAVLRNGCQGGLTCNAWWRNKASWIIGSVLKMRGRSTCCSNATCMCVITSS